MKRWGLLAAAALLSVGTALAAEEPSRHIRTTISGEAYAVAVDADVYGEGQKAVQAYRVTTLDLGKNPEAHFDLALWFGTDALLEKTGGDYTIFYPKGEDAEIGARDEAGFSPYGLYFERATNARLEFPLERWNYRQIQEKTNAAENPRRHLLNGCDRQYSVHCKRAGRDDGTSSGLYIRDDAGGLAGGDGAKDGAGHCAA